MIRYDRKDVTVIHKPITNSHLDGLLCRGKPQHTQTEVVLQHIEFAVIVKRLRVHNAEIHARQQLHTLLALELHRKHRRTFTDNMKHGVSVLPCNLATTHTNSVPRVSNYSIRVTPNREIKWTFRVQHHCHYVHIGTEPERRAGHRSPDNYTEHRDIKT